jgi:hypothetical protein
MVRYAIPLGLTALVSVCVTPSPSLADAAIAERCQAYPSHLRVARAYLAEGKRAAALAALRLADDALRSCLRDEAAGGSLIAGHGGRNASG